MTAVATWPSKMCSFGLKGTADPLLCQDPRTVLPTYASLMDTEASNDFSDNEVMPSNRLYSLYLLRGDANASSSAERADQAKVKLEPNVKVNGEHHNGLDGKDALFEGMPFFELRTKEVGPCAYCNIWSPVRYMSYCGKFPFCSVYCTKKFAVYKRDLGELSEISSTQHELKGKMKVPTLFEDNKPKPLFPSNHQTTPPKVTPRKVTHYPPDGSPPFDWSAYLESEKADAAPIRCFKHAPLSTEWKSSLLGAMLEVQTKDETESPNTFWVARIIQVAGYRVRLRFEGYGIDSTRDFWIHLCTTESFPINGAVRMGKRLRPPKDVMDRLGDSWLEHISKVAHAGSLTISVPIDKVKQGLSCPFKVGMKLEAVYKRQLSHTCVAKVINVVADRIHVQYENCKEPNKDFWFHFASSWIHPVGWSQRVGHRIIASAAFKSEALDKGRHKKTGFGDAPWEIFRMPPAVENHGFSVGMKMEVVDPLKLGNICAATVMEVLEEGYLMIAIDGCMEDKSSWFCYHVTSPLLLPVGFCEHHKIPIVPPRGYENRFDWVDYLKETQSIAAPVELFKQDIKDRGFRPGQKIEAVDLIEPGLICVASIVKTAGSLISVHFDGWESSFDQWTDCSSSNVYPVGWCEMVGYPLQAPKVLELHLTSNGGMVKSFKKRSRHSSSEKKRKLETGGKVSASGLQRKSLGSKKIKDKLSVKKKITPDIYWKQTGQDRVPSLDELERIPTGGGKDLSKVELLVGRYSFDKGTAATCKSGSISSSGIRSSSSSVAKERKKRLKKSKKEKRERKREKKKKEKKKSKDKSHRKKNKHKQNSLGKIDSVKHLIKPVPPRVSEESKNSQSAEENFSVDVVSTDKPLHEDIKAAPKLEPAKLHLSKEARNSNVYFVSESTRPKFESMFGDRQGFVFEKKKKVCAAKEKEKGKILIDVDEHDPYSLEAEFPSVKSKEPVTAVKEKMKYSTIRETLDEVLKQTGKLADSIKMTHSPDNAKGKGTTKLVMNSTSPLSTSCIPPNSVPSVLDSPISLSSTQSTSSTGNIPTSSSSQLSPVHQRLSSLPTPSSCGEEEVQQHQVTVKEEQSFDDGDVNDLMDIIENDLASSLVRNLSPSEPSPLTKEVLSKNVQERVQSEMDADQKVEEILRAIRESSGHSTLSQAEVKPTPVKAKAKSAETTTTTPPVKKKARSRSKSLDKPPSAKKVAKAHKSHLASLLQRPVRLSLGTGEAPFYADGKFSPGNPAGGGGGATPGLPPAGPLQPSNRSSPGNNHDGTKTGSLLVEMLNCNTARPSEANKAASSAAAAPVATPKSRKVTSSPFEGAQHLKRPTNLKFPTRQQQQHQQQLTPPASFPNISTSNQAAMLMELVRPSIAKAAVMSNPQSPVVSTQQYNLSLGILQNHMHLEQHAPLQFLQRPQVPQAPPNHPNHRMAHWMNQGQISPVSPVAHQLSPQVPAKVPFRFPGRFPPQRLPPMQSLLRGLQNPMLPKSPPSPALPVGQLSPKITQYQFPSGVGGFSFQQASSEMPSPQSRPVTPQAKEDTSGGSGGGNPVQKVPKNANPWYWSVPEVMQFLHDAGEGVCADTFYRQQINGQKLMSLNKEQIAKLTGVKVASSLKIYQQISKLQSMFPHPPPLALPPSPSQGPSQ